MFKKRDLLSQVSFVIHRDGKNHAPVSAPLRRGTAALLASGTQTSPTDAGQAGPPDRHYFIKSAISLSRSGGQNISPNVSVFLN